MITSSLDSNSASQGPGRREGQKNVGRLGPEPWHPGRPGVRGTSTQLKLGLGLESQPIFRVQHAPVTAHDGALGPAGSPILQRRSRSRLRLGARSGRGSRGHSQPTGGQLEQPDARTDPGRVQLHSL
jgi:hypothetical protein